MKNSNRFAYQNNLRTSDFAYHMVKISVVWLIENIRSDKKNQIVITLDETILRIFN